ncbi:MAG: GGDEF domain-containing protein, partial [Nitrospirota bacterium]|nr:GGDEF domain-containing protein [Nitrospirota bacterium]
DNLKEINDISGHKAGDEAIIDTARILKATYRKSDIIARISGDEFAVFLMANSENDAYVISSRLQKNVDNHNNSCDRKLSLSYGMAVFPPDSIQNLEDMLVQADNLMYQHKKSKKAP